MSERAPRSPDYDAVVVGAGPNGLAAAILLAQSGHSVLLVEGKETVGGGSRTAELTLPGYAHDICSAVHPMGVGSPFLRTLPLADHGLEWIQPPAPAAHPLDDGTAVTLERSVEETCAGLGGDSRAYRNLMAPLVEKWDRLVEDLLAPLALPKHPFAMARFGLTAVRSARALAEGRFQEPRARALFAGMAAHGMMTLEASPTAGFGLALTASGHAFGWPLAKGGSQSIADALAAHFRDLGGEIVTGWMVESVDELPKCRAALFDVTPRQLLAMAGARLPARYRERLERFRHGPGVFKLDWALERPIPWEAHECARSATVHLGGTLEEIASSEREVAEGRHPERPYVLVVQPTLFDPSRAPAGKHIAWAYCHVPNGSTFDMTDRVEGQIERFAPGFRECILAGNVMPPASVEAHNPNYIGGDISGGVQDLRQTFFRPAPQLNPYATPVKGWYLCSSSTPPGGAVHGMCGYHAAKRALRYLA
jgi:phytoene dehydrogenase-like protein